MKFSKADFPLIRWGILAICAASLVSAIILYSSGKYVEQAQKDRRSAQNMLKDARNRLATALQDQENMAIYAGEYGALIEQKIIGDDQRLDWMEGLERIRQKNLVTDFSYSIAPQKIYVAQPPIDGGNFDIHYSEMKLHLDLLHIVQLEKFFAALHTDIKGMYLLDGCTLQRTGNGAGANSAAQIKAECSGGWITLKNRNAQP